MAKKVSKGMDLFPDVEKQINDVVINKDIILERELEKTANIAKDNCPVKTGKLKNSIGVKKTKKGFELIADTSYALKVHELPGPGSKYLHNAVNATKPSLKKELEKVE